MLNQKGFNPVFLLIGVLIILAASGGSYYLFTKNYKPSENINPQTSSQEPIKTLQPRMSPFARQISSTSTTSGSVKPRSFVVKGSSMTPHYLSDQIWLYEPYNNEQPKRSDVVIFDNPVATGNTISKRIIALPNEKVRISTGKIYINEQLLEEPYTSTTTATGSSADNPFIVGEQEKIIPTNTYFVLGDNRPVSNDSRNWGPISKDKIIGKLTVQIQPLSMPSNPEECSCLDRANNLCLPQIACQ